MKRSLMALAALAAVSAQAIVPASPQTAGRHFSLDEGGAKAAGLVRFYSQAIELAEGAKQCWVTITRTGDFYDPRYGDFKITPTHLEQMVKNFDARVAGQDIFLDVAHRPSDGAAGKFLKLAIEGTRLRGLVEWTEFGMDAVKKRGFAYLSAEFHENWKDNEKQQSHGCVLLGAGLTTRPVIKNLEPVQLAEAEHDHADGMRLCISPGLLRELTEHPSLEESMNFLEQLKKKLLAMGLNESVVTKLLAQAEAQLKAAADDKAKEAIVLAWEATGQTVQAELKKLGEGAAGNVTITLAAPGAGSADVEGAVARALAQRDQAAEQQRTTLQGKLKLLSDTIAAGDTTLDAAAVKALADQVTPLVTAASTDDQVKALANLQVENAKKLSAAQKLVSLGYQPASGSVQITVDDGNVIKSLQETIDRRLGFKAPKADTLDTKRFFATGGKLLEQNREFAERALAHFDSQPHVALQLREEHKALAAGTGTISDIKVPTSVERTVLREMLYNLVSLNFVDVGTAPFAPTVQIPYSYRDTTAAGVGRVRRYEQQAIQRAGVIQTWDTAYPLPQKLAFRVSNEMRYLMAAAPIDFEPIAENVRNMIRILGEDTEAINMNELVRSADEFAPTAVVGEVLTASVNGARSIFPLANFPVVRPRTVYDLQGNVVVATVNPITVTLAGVVRNEYVLPSDGSALAAGTYWIMDWNLGELRLVDQTGAPVMPANATALTVSYSWATNAAKFSTDLGALTVGQVYDNLLTAIGGRKVVIGNDRFYNPNMVAMSLAVDNMLSQATTFTANGARAGTSLNADGSVGITKGMATFNPTAPGLMMGDTRILVGERGNTRFRMVKPFAMNPLEEARDGQGNFIGAKEGYGEQFIVSHTPVNRRNALTSVIVYSAAGRVAR